VFLNHKSGVSLSNNRNGGDGKSVGIVFPGYGYERVCYGLPMEKFYYKKVYSVPIHRILKKNNFYRNTPIILEYGLDFLHTWNAIPIGNSPFIMSFENEIPRYFGQVYKWQEKLGLSVLKSDRCRGIFALSKVAAELAKIKMDKLGYPEISSKIQVFRGGVKIDPSLLLYKEGKYSEGKCLNIVFVGGDIFPKGFVPAFEALEQLVQAGVKIKLTVIGQFKKGAYVLRELSPDQEVWNSIIKSAEWVEHHERLPNKEVLETISRSDLLISPSYDETLGWAVIEAGLLGVPAITTNVFAFPELVEHNFSGFIIELNIGKQRRWQGVWESGALLKKELNIANKAIFDGVTEAVLAIVEQPEMLSAWSQEIKKHMKDLYDPTIAALTLSNHYKKALAIE